MLMMIFSRGKGDVMKHSKWFHKFGQWLYSTKQKTKKTRSCGYQCIDRCWKIKVLKAMYVFYVRVRFNHPVYFHFPRRFGHGRNGLPDSETSEPGCRDLRKRRVSSSSIILPILFPLFSFFYWIRLGNIVVVDDAIAVNKLLLIRVIQTELVLRTRSACFLCHLFNVFN